MPKPLDFAELRKRCAVPILTVYKNPKDYPGKFVIRLFNINRPTMLSFAADSLAEIRQYVPREMCRMPRRPEDDPCIVEVYM